VNKVRNSTNAYLLNQLGANIYSFYALDMPDGKQQYVYYQQSDSVDLLIEIAGSINLTELKSYPLD
jgi:hypothetical protein